MARKEATQVRRRDPRLSRAVLDDDALRAVTGGASAAGAPLDSTAEIARASDVRCHIHPN